MIRFDPGMTREAERVVDTLCADYGRRQKAILSGKLSEETERTYRHLNEVIEEGVASSCEEALREEMLRDLQERRGYNRSPMIGISEGAYKLRKRIAKEAIARSLHYI